MVTKQINNPSKVHMKGVAHAPRSSCSRSTGAPYLLTASAAYP